MTSCHSPSVAGSALGPTATIIPGNLKGRQERMRVRLLGFEKQNGSPILWAPVLPNVLFVLIDPIRFKSNPDRLRNALAATCNEARNEANNCENKEDPQKCAADFH